MTVPLPTGCGGLHVRVMPSRGGGGGGADALSGVVLPKLHCIGDAVAMKEATKQRGGVEALHHLLKI